MFLRIFVYTFFLLSLIPTLSAYEATYYADSFEGKSTSNGSRFSNSGYSAAICDLDLGQYAYVQYQSTWAVVTLNDRPNCRRYADTIDLTTQAFSLFAPTRQGRITDVSVTPIGNTFSKVVKKDFPLNIFSSLGVSLLTPLSNTYFAGDQVFLEGRVTDNKRLVLLYLEDSTTKETITKLITTDDTGYFRAVIPFPKVSGSYAFILASGNSFSGVIPETILLVDRSTLTYPTLPSGSFRMTSFRPDTSMTSNQSLLRLPDKMWGSLELTQWTKTTILHGTSFDLSEALLSTGMTDISLRLKKLSTPSSLDQMVDYGKVWTGKVDMQYRSDIVGRENIILRQNKKSVSFRFQVPKTTTLLAKYYFTLPSGDVREFIFPKEYTTEGGTLKSWIWVTGTLALPSNGIYKLEINTKEGIAYINIPISQGIIWQVVQPLSDEEKYTQRTVVSRVQVYVLSRINLLRSQLNRTELTLDPTLTKIALLKAQDMYDRDYFGHRDPDGNYITDFARARGFDTGWLGENIASWYNVSDRALQYGLEESPWHRANMIEPSYKKVGIGYYLKNKKIYLVHVFSR